MVYHVSSTPGIKVLTPRVSTHKKAYVYAIESLVTGLLFGVRHDDFDLFLNTNAQGIPEVYECYPGSFRAVYQGKACSVYELKEDGFQRGMTSWSPELVSESETAVEREVVIDDLYSRLLQEQEKGNLILHPYADSPEYKKLISEHIVDRLIRFNALDHLETDLRFQKYFRPIIDALRSVMDGHLLVSADSAAPGSVSREDTDSCADTGDQPSNTAS